MNYEVHLSSNAYSFLRRLEKGYRTRIIGKLEMLSREPYMKGVKKIAGRKESLFRVRVGPYRILYEVLEEKKVILVIKIDKRSRVYR